MRINRSYYSMISVKIKSRRARLDLCLVFYLTLRDDEGERFSVTRINET